MDTVEGELCACLAVVNPVDQQMHAVHGAIWKFAALCGLMLASSGCARHGLFLDCSLELNRVPWRTGCGTGQRDGGCDDGGDTDDGGDCQKCGDRGIMEGKLCGEVVDAGDSRLKGCKVIAAYRIKFDHSVGFISTAAVGTIEGVVVCFCNQVNQA